MSGGLLLEPETASTLLYHSSDLDITPHCIELCSYAFIDKCCVVRYTQFYQFAMIKTVPSSNFHVERKNE